MLIQRSLPILLAVLCIASRPVLAQQPPAKPPAVGVVRASLKPVTPSNEYVGRIQAVERVNLVARVSAFLEERLFTEGAEVKKGDLLYRLEQGPFQADVAAKQAVVAQYKAQLQNARSEPLRAPGPCSTPPPASNRPSTPRSPISYPCNRRCRGPRRSSNNPRSISTIPRSTRRSTARSAARR